MSSVIKLVISFQRITAVCDCASDINLLKEPLRDGLAMWSDSVIIGGGLAGLSLAINLSRSSKVLILESESNLGGLARSYVVKNVVFNSAAELCFMDFYIVQIIIQFHAFAIQQFLEQFSFIGICFVIFAVDIVHPPLRIVLLNVIREKSGENGISGKRCRGRQE